MEWLKQMHNYEWVFHAAIAFGTFLAVVVALFGEKIKSIWFHPKLRLTLMNRFGTAARVPLKAPESAGGGTRMADARYYHLNVGVDGRWPPATNVQVFLIQVEELDAGGQLRVTWAGDVPLIWRHQVIFPLARTIGADAHCDFLSVVEGKWVNIETVIQVVGFPFNNRRDPFAGAVFTVQARATEADSRIVRIRVSWDGKWASGEVEMSGHLVVEELQEVGPI